MLARSYPTRLMCMKIRIVGLLLLGLIAGFGANAQVWLIGYAPGSQGDSVAVFRVSDFLSETRTKIATVPIDDRGSFELKIITEETQVWQLQIQGRYATLVVQPNSKYPFTFPLVKELKARTLFDNQVELEVQRGTETSDINAILTSFNSRLASKFDDYAMDFSYKYSTGSSSFVNSRKGELVKSGMVNEEDEATVSANVDPDFMHRVKEFRGVIEQNYASAFEDPFFVDYVNYSIAQLELYAGRDRWEIYYQYLNNLPVKVGNPEYMHFFRAFYGGMFSGFASDGKNTEVVRTINGRRDAYKLDSVLAVRRYMEDRDVRQMATLVNLQSLYHDRSWSSEAIKTTMEHALTLEEYKNCHSHIESVLGRLTFGSAGDKLLDFRMLDNSEEIVHLSDYAGKFVYIGFFADWCGDCYREMELLEKYKSKYGADIEFVSISLDDSYERFISFVQMNHNMDWTFLYGPSEERLRDIFAIRAVPMFILIDPNGRLMYDYTRKPSEGINLEFDRITKRSATDNRIKVWDD
jgi:thiol-disulfide isomerase/thioredoxin